MNFFKKYRAHLVVLFALLYPACASFLWAYIVFAVPVEVTKKLVLSDAAFWGLLIVPGLLSLLALPISNRKILVGAVAATGGVYLPVMYQVASWVIKETWTHKVNSLLHPYSLMHL